jgi:hypothetical protein
MRGGLPLDMMAILVFGHVGANIRRVCGLLHLQIGI